VAQQERKAALDPGRVDTAFKVGDQVLLRTKELLDAAEVGKLRPRWEGPFRVAALAGPNTYTLTLPRRFKCSPTVNVDRLKPFYPRAGRPAPPGPVADPGQEGEHVVEQLLNRKTLRGRTYYLVRWQGHASAEDSWEPVEHLANCPERIAEYEAAAPRRPKARRAQQRTRDLPAQVSPPLPADPPPGPTRPDPPPGWAVVAVAGPPGLGSAILYWWPDEGWQLGHVRRRSRKAPFTHVVGFRAPTAAFTGDVNALLDAASYGSQWVALSPVSP